MEFFSIIVLISILSITFSEEIKFRGEGEGFFTSEVTDENRVLLLGINDNGLFKVYKDWTEDNFYPLENGDDFYLSFLDNFNSYLEKEDAKAVDFATDPTNYNEGSLLFVVVKHGDNSSILGVSVKTGDAKTIATYENADIRTLTTSKLTKSVYFAGTQNNQEIIVTLSTVDHTDQKIIIQDKNCSKVHSILYLEPKEYQDTPREDKLYMLCSDSEGNNFFYHHGDYSDDSIQPIHIEKLNSTKSSFLIANHDQYAYFFSEKNEIFIIDLFELTHNSTSESFHIGNHIDLDHSCPLSIWGTGCTESSSFVYPPNMNCYEGGSFFRYTEFTQSFVPLNENDGAQNYPPITNMRFIFSFDKFQNHFLTCAKNGTCPYETENVVNLFALVLTISIPVILAALVVIVVLLTILSITFLLIWKNRKFFTVEDVDIILEEQKLLKNSDIAHFKPNKDLSMIKFNDLKIVKQIGQGGSNSTVFEAIWLGRKVAFKAFKPEDFMEEAKFQEFEREVNLMSSISHPYLLSFYGTVIEQNRIGIVMEYGEKGDLVHYLEQWKKTNTTALPWSESLRILSEIGTGLLFLHTKKIIHRDVKLENVLVTKNNVMKVCDFGLSKIQSLEQTKRVGTSHYMSPEVAKGEEYDYRADVYSFGILAYMLLALDFQPYKSYQTSTFNIENKIANDPNMRPPIDELKIKDWMKALIKRTWAHKKEDRPPFCEILITIQKDPEAPKDVICPTKEQDSAQTSSTAEDYTTINEL